MAAGDFEAARGYLDRETAGEDPALLMALVDIELRSGQLDQAREILPQLLAIDRELRHKIVELAWALTDSNPAAAFVCIDAAVDASTVGGRNSTMPRRFCRSSSRACPRTFRRC